MSSKRYYIYTTAESLLRGIQVFNIFVVAVEEISSEV